MVCRREALGVAARATLLTLALCVLAPSGAHAVGRGIEMVSPVEKDADVLVSDGAALGATHQAALDGQSLAFGSSGGFARAQSSLLYGIFLARRGGEPVDWMTESLNAMQGSYVSLRLYSLFANSKDLTRTVFGSRAALAPGAVEGDGNLYIRDNRTGVVTLVVHDTSSAFRGLMDTTSGNIVYGGTSDFSRIVFQANTPLVPEAPTGVNNAYEWSFADGLRLVNYDVGPGRTVSANGGSPGRADGIAHSPNVMSQDGRRIFFTNFGDGGVYVRDNDETVPVSISRATGDDPSIAQSATFLAANTPGTRVVFSSQRKLTDDSRSGSYGNLYEYDVNSRSIRDLGEPADPANVNQARVNELLGMSASGDTVYFMAESDLAPGGVDGSMNVYVNRDGDLRHVATLDPAVNPPAQQTPSVSPDGRYLTFRTFTPLAGYDNVSSVCARNAESRCAMVFVYDAVADQTTCVSCISDGTRSRGSANVGGQASAVAPAVSGYYARAALDSAVFFDTPDGLVPQDVNNRYDVYVFRGGTPELMTQGNRNFDAKFVDASLSGDDVFFTTRQQLVSQDVDPYSDVYDWRTDGGIPSQNPPPTRDACEGLSCRNPDGGAPLLPLVTSGSALSDDLPAPTPPKVTVRIVRRQVVGPTLRLRVAVSHAGTVRVTGRGLASGVKRVSKAATVGLTVRLNRSGRSELKRGGRLRVNAKVTLKTARRGTASASVRAVLKEKR